MIHWRLNELWKHPVSSWYPFISHPYIESAHDHIQCRVMHQKWNMLDIGFSANIELSTSNKDRLVALLNLYAYHITAMIGRRRERAVFLPVSQLYWEFYQKWDKGVWWQLLPGTHHAIRNGTPHTSSTGTTEASCFFANIVAIDLEQGLACIAEFSAFLCRTDNESITVRYEIWFHGNGRLLSNESTISKWGQQLCSCHGESPEGCVPIVRG